MMGNVIMSGIVPQLSRKVNGILASDLAVGSIVYIKEYSDAIPYIIVNKGVPSGSNLYDASCDGVWLMRQYPYYTPVLWNSANRNDYQNSNVHSFLNNTFFEVLNSVAKSAIKTVKIPYVNGIGTSAIASGSKGLSTKVFLLGGYEVGWTISSYANFPIDGACLEYFKGTASTDSKRIAYEAEGAVYWWLRSPYNTDEFNVWLVSKTGSFTASGVNTTPYYARPAFVLPKNAVFDEKTLILKGVY